MPSQHPFACHSLSCTPATRAWALGVFTSFTSNTSKTETINSNSDSFSYLIGPFVRFNATPNITLSASVSAGSTDTDLNVGGATSSFDSTQQLATLGIRGGWSEGNWTFAPAAGISYSVTRSDGFTDSSASFGYTRSGIFSDVDGWSITAGASAPINLLIPALGRDATTNFQFTAEPHAGQTYMLRVVIPVF